MPLRSSFKVVLFHPLVYALLLACGLSGAETATPARGENPPRKAIISTTVFDLFERPWVDVDHRLQELSLQIDKMAADARSRYGRAMDLAVLPENALHPRTSDLLAGAVDLNDGKILAVLGAKARQHKSYLVVGLNVVEDHQQAIVYNAALLFDREGEVQGIYRKVFPVADPGADALEGGKSPGTEFPVFETDFGRIGILICWDLGSRDAVQAYAAQNVDLIVWPTESPQTLLPRMYCREYAFFMVSATPRDNASIFDPAGQVVAQAKSANSVISQEVDFEYKIIHWQSALRDGAVFREAYGNKVGYRYLPREDTGIFWSNDPAKPIARMLIEQNIVDENQLRAHTIKIREKVIQEKGG